MPQIDHRYHGGARQGQALLVAVLLMMVILLTGILFVAIVSYNQQQSVRSSDVLAAQSLAEAGIRWCNQNLMHSPQGADWRPPFKPLDLATYNPADRTTWPVPPVIDTAGNPYGVLGPDPLDSTDDYYSDFELLHNWCGLVTIQGNTVRYRRYGFYRIPDVNNPANPTPLPEELASLGGKGHILVRVTYDPDPPYEPSDTNRVPDPMSAYIKIEAVGVVDTDVPVFRYLCAYKPIGLTDYMLFVTDKNDYGKPTKLGFNPYLDMDRDGTNEFLRQDFFGPLKFNTPLDLTGQQFSTSINLTSAPTSANRYELLNPVDGSLIGQNPIITGGGYLRADRLEAQGIAESPANAGSTIVRERRADESTTNRGQLFTSSNPSGFDTYPAYNPLTGLYDGYPLVADGDQGTDAAGFSRFCKPLAAPEVFSPRGVERYRTLTRDSGIVVQTASGEIVNTGQFGLGRGVYVDNKGDLQYVDQKGKADLDALLAEWRQAFPDDFTRENSGWNPTYTTYTAPGVEIILFPTESAALEFGRLTYSATPPNRPGVVWWPNHQPGAPGIRLTRSDRPWQWCDTSVAPAVVRDSGEYTLYVDYPAYPNQVIFAEGNVRVRGALPRADVTTPIRDYNLTIVSGGNIYIDGQILSPQDLDGRDPGTGNGNCPDEYNSKLALLAKYCVCLNTTRLVPQLTSGEVSAAPDDPANPDYTEQHWVLSPETVGAAHSSWTFGEWLLPNQGVGLAVAHTANDPGPAAISMNIFNDMTGVMQRYDFDPTTAGPQNKFYFVQPNILPPAANVEFALAPTWGQLLSGFNPLVPWDIKSYIADIGGSPQPGALKSISISATDPAIPGIGGGATDYWIKKWKVYETYANGQPAGAVHAKVNALIYAENGCWFVIPGRYFDPTQVGDLARRFRRYNYDICVRGMISEAFHAQPEVVREWCDKWAWPAPNGAWYTIRYEFDESLRVPRHQAITTLAGDLRTSSLDLPPSEQANLPKVPLLPVSKDLIFYSEGP